MQTKKKVIAAIIGAAVVIVAAVALSARNSDSGNNGTQQELTQSSEETTLAAAALLAQLEANTSVSEEFVQEEFVQEEQAATETVQAEAAAAEEEAWRQAYIDLVNQFEVGQYDFGDEAQLEAFHQEMEEYGITAGCGYSLIRLDHQGVPELVIEMGTSQGFRTTWIYTYDNDMLYKVAALDAGMHDHYEYIPEEGMVVDVAVDGAGTIYYYDYSQMDQNYQLTPLYQETLYINGERGDAHYYLNDTEITETEYEIYFAQRSFEDLGGGSDAAAIIHEIKTY